jgi:pantoate kinase
MTTAKAFAPAAISSFFEIHDTENNQPITDLKQVGARGGGFGLERGVSTEVSVEEAKSSSIMVFINGKSAPEAQTTNAVVTKLLSQAKRAYSVVVKHRIEVPIGTGFGTSAGGALTAGLALKQALDLPLTYNQIGQASHLAEIECGTGLGTVSSLTYTGGCVLVVEPGAPGICQLDRIPITPDYLVVVGFFGSNKPKTALSNPQQRQFINRFGKQTLDAILANPTLPNFLDCCWKFAQDAGFTTVGTRRLVGLAKQAGAVGAAQNMIGEAVHAVVHQDNAESVAEAFKGVLTSEKVFISNLDFQGARLIE